MREFPDDDSCLQWLWLNRFSKDGIHANCRQCEPRPIREAFPPYRPA